MLTKLLNWCIAPLPNDDSTPPLTPEPVKPTHEKTEEPDIRPTIHKLIKAMENGRWEVKWKQDEGLGVFRLFGEIFFSAKPKGSKSLYPRLRCRWHPAADKSCVRLHGVEDVVGDPYSMGGKEIKLTLAEEKSIIDYLVSTLPEEYQEDPVNALVTDRLKALEAYI